RQKLHVPCGHEHCAGGVFGDMGVRPGKDRRGNREEYFQILEGSGSSAGRRTFRAGSGRPFTGIATGSMSSALAWR
ncbi:hypothetical protein U6V07_12390, partial [Cutibacterium acnes]